MQAVVAGGGAQVDGGEHPEGVAGFEMLGEYGLQQAQPAPLDEGTEQIDPIGGGHLRLQGQPHTGLTGGIDQQGAIRQGKQGPGDGLLAGQQRSSPQLLQQAGAGVEPIARCDRFRCLLLQHRHDPVHQGQLLLLPLGLRQRRQGDLTELPQVTGQPLGSFGRIERLQPVQGGQLGGERLVLGLAEGVVVEAGGEVLRGHEWPVLRLRSVVSEKKLLGQAD